MESASRRCSKLITGDLTASDGTISVDGQIGVMHQRVGTDDHPATTGQELRSSLAPTRLGDATDRLTGAEQRLDDAPMDHADALARWGDAGGFDLEVAWNECVTRAFGESFTEVRDRPVRTLSGGEQKRLVLKTLLRSEFDILVLDEPDNFLDVPAKRWLEGQLDDTRKAVLFTGHDRELLAATAGKIVTIEARGAWTHDGSLATYNEDNLDLMSAEALEHSRAQFDGTVVAVTHDRWLLRSFDRFVVFADAERLPGSAGVERWSGSRWRALRPTSCHWLGRARCRRRRRPAGTGTRHRR